MVTLQVAQGASLKSDQELTRQLKQFDVAAAADLVGGRGRAGWRRPLKAQSF